MIYQYKTSVWTEQWARRELQSSAQEQTATLDEIFNGRFTVLETFANSLASQAETPTKEDVTNRMKAIVEVSDFELLAITGLDGIIYTSEGKVDNSPKPLYMTEALAGRKSAQKIDEGQVFEKDWLVLAVPVYVNAEVKGVVMGGFSTAYFEKLLVAHAFSGSAYSFVCDSSGNIIVGPEKESLLNDHDNVLTFFSENNAEFLEGMSLKTITDDLKNGREALAIYLVSDEKRYAVYQPTGGINDWYIFNIVPGEIVDGMIAEQTNLGSICIFVVALCAVLLIVIMAAKEKQRIQELKQLQAAELVSFRTDPVTGLYNVSGFTYAVTKALHTLPEEHFCALIDFGILNFNQYNVSFGSPAGNAVLRGAAQVLLEHCQGHQPCARLSGDRFAFLMTDCNNQAELLKQIALLDEKLHKPDGTHRLLLSYGVYIVTDRSQSLEEMCNCAVAARLTANLDDSNVSVYEPVIHQQQIDDSQMLEDMEEGLRLGQFIPYYQPKYDTHTERIIGAEALVRWILPNNEVRLPNRFIPLFEQNGLITKLDLYLFEKICQKLSKMSKPVPISTNFSRAHLYDSDFPHKINTIAEKYGVPHHLLEIELTETAFFDRPDALIKMINRLREMGFLLSIDDFGSGYSSLNLLKDVCFDVIKLDKQFLSETAETERGMIVIKSVLALASSLDVHTVAEGVETRQQFEFLRDNGCDYIQGYYFCRPVLEEEFDKLINAQYIAQ